MAYNFAEFVAHHFGEDIREMRAERGMTYKEIGAALNLREHTVRVTCKIVGVGGGVRQAGYKRSRPTRNTSRDPITPEEREALNRRDDEIIRLREQKWTYQKLADKYGISRERIRQILHAAGRGDLCRYFTNTEDHTCAQCGKVFQAYAKNRDKPRKFCSPPCSHEYMREHRQTKRESVGKEIYEARIKTKRTWASLGREHYPETKQPGALAQSTAHRYAEYHKLPWPPVKVYGVDNLRHPKPAV